MITNLGKHYTKVHQTELVPGSHQILCFCVISNNITDVFEHLLTHPASITNDVSLDKLCDFRLNKEDLSSVMQLKHT